MTSCGTVLAPVMIPNAAAASNVYRTRCRIKRTYDPGRGRTLSGGDQCSINVRSLRDRRQRQLLDIGPYRAETTVVMPNASQRYSADAIISNRAALGDRAFVEFSRTLNGQAPGRESQHRIPDPVLPITNVSQTWILSNSQPCSHIRRTLR